MVNYQPNGNLVPGIHDLNWEEFSKEFGHNRDRKKLLAGLDKAIGELRDVGCKILYVDGSFVSKNLSPKDFDACWDPTGVDFAKMAVKYPVLLEFLPTTKNQKSRYGGELFPSPNFLYMPT